MIESVKERVDIDVAVIGAGPYGFLPGPSQGAGLYGRVFGQPMEFWADKMPEGMLLRSPRVASNISDPDIGLYAGCLREAFGNGAGRASSAENLRGIWPLVSASTWFGFGPTVRESGDRQGDEFHLDLSDGQLMRSDALLSLPALELSVESPLNSRTCHRSIVSHCYEGRKIREFKGKKVAVIGAGQSALESAALLHEAGADVEIIAKIPELRWIGMHGWLHHIGPISNLLYSRHDVGPLGISRLVAAPKLVNRIPLEPQR